MKTNSMSDNLPDLPQEIISDILIRLPVKSIGRSRCVSKLWLSLLTRYDFIKAHLAHHSHSLAQQQILLLPSFSSSLFSLILHPGGNRLRQLEFFNEEVSTLLGSCNGLVLVSAGRYDWLVNCMTEEYVRLPNSPIALCGHPCVSVYGFGYDSLSDDYKLVKISQCSNHKFGLGMDCGDNLVDIFSLKMSCWKRFGTSSYGHNLHFHYSALSCLFFNGAIHRLGRCKSSDKESVVIVAFDLSCEKFKEIPVPAPLDNVLADLAVLGELRVIDGCLGITVEVGYPATRTEIWLMKSYSLVESWTKLVVDFEPLCFHQDKILFRDGCARELKWYCLKDGGVEVCLAEDDEDEFREGITYSGSLVSPHFNSQN